MCYIRSVVKAGILGLVVCGVFLRFAFLYIAFEYDELFTAITVNPSLSLMWIIKHWLLIDVHPPLYNILLYFYNCFYYTQAEWWIRVPSVCFSLLSVIVAWRMFPGYLGRYTRFIFVGFLACSFQLMRFAPQARSYSLLLLLSLIHMFVSLDIWRLVWRNRDVPFKKYLYWMVWSGLLAYTHYFGLAVFCASGILIGAGLLGHRRSLIPFVYYFGGMFMSVCLWLVPNFLSNLEQQRFSGDWWAADYAFTEGIFQTAQFVFCDYLIYAFVCLFCLGILLWEAKRFFKGKNIPFLREKVFLFGVISLVVLTVLLLSVKLYLIVPRFFIVLFPYIYLFVALFSSKLVRKSTVALVVFGAICAWNICTFAGNVTHRYAQQPDNAKEFAIHFFKEHPGQKLFVFVLDGLPVPAMQAMFSYYFQEYYAYNVSVTVLNPLLVPDMKQLLRQNPEAVIWLPNCDSEKISRLRQITGWVFYREKDIGTHCELKTHFLAGKSTD